MKKPTFIIKDGGVRADFTCACGHIIKVNVWGMVYKRDRKGNIISYRYQEAKKPKKCRCGKLYSFVAIPDIGYIELSKERKDERRPCNRPRQEEQR